MTTQVTFASGAHCPIGDTIEVGKTYTFTVTAFVKSITTEAVDVTRFGRYSDLAPAEINATIIPTHVLLEHAA